MDKKQEDDKPVLEKTCDLCKKITGTGDKDTIFFGEWMTRSDVTVHYYCLLLSTNLQQRGEDHGGILGFLLRDIRKEINAAKQRSCTYCRQQSASIKCCKCKKYFHMICGHTNKCLFVFADEFKSYCGNCVPLNANQKKLLQNPPDPLEYPCLICRASMGQYRPYSWISANCCKFGYVHSVCMKKYALTAGYYLKCLWCKSKQFRDDVKYLGIFVPDRDANWEREKGAYKDIHKPNQRCDMDTCHCNKGRDYTNGQKWKIIRCKLCGLIGAHNPYCIPGMELQTTKPKEVEEFKCDTCAVTERTVLDITNVSINTQEIQGDINGTLYVNKNSENTEFSDDSVSSMETVIHTNVARYSPSSATNIVVPLLTQCDEAAVVPMEVEPEPHQVISSSVVSLHHNEKEAKKDDDDPPSYAMTMAVDRMLALF